MTGTTPIPKLGTRLAVLALGAVAIAVLAVLLLGGDNGYTLKLQMKNASGLRPGSQVLLGGVNVGTVDKLDIDHNNMVVAKLHLDRNKVHVGEGVKAKILAANLLGEKYVALQPGDAQAPLPSGATLSPASISTPTDLDEVVDVMDGRTRADLATLLSEAGRGVAGRRRDVSALMRQIPLSLSAAQRLLHSLVQDNHTLSDLIVNADRFIGRADRQSDGLRRLVDASSGAADSLAARSPDLRRAVVGAPNALATAGRFFAQGTDAVERLRPAAAQIADAAPVLRQVLAEVKPFTRAAVPTLDRAAAVAPTLSDLSTKGTPIVKQAVPAVASLRAVAKTSQPLSEWLRLSSPDLFNSFNWAEAVQYRDGLSHIFNGNVYINPWIVPAIASRGASRKQRCANFRDVLGSGFARTIRLTQPTDGVCTRTEEKTRKIVERTERKLKDLVPQIKRRIDHAPKTPLLDAPAKVVEQTLQKVTGAVLGGGSAQSGSGGSSGADNVSPLLDFLLGK